MPVIDETASAIVAKKCKYIILDFNLEQKPK